MSARPVLRHRADLVSPECGARKPARPSWRKEDPEDFPFALRRANSRRRHLLGALRQRRLLVYDAAKLHALGNVDEIYEPAYVEDLDLGYRAWQRGWPSVYVNGAVVEHRHRATTSRYYSEAELERILEINYLRFLARAVSDSKVFRTLWDQAILRLELRAAASPAARTALRAAPAIAVQGGPPASAISSEEEFLALTNGATAVFPGTAQPGKPRMVIVTPSLTARLHVAIEEHDLIFIAFADTLARPDSQLLAGAVEIVLVRRSNSPLDRLAFHAALSLTLQKWQPASVRLETPGMTRYTADCAPAKIILGK